MPEDPVIALVTSPLGENCLEKIAGVSPRVRVKDVSHLLDSERDGDGAASEQLDLLLADAEVIFGLELPGGLARRATGEKWVQVMSAGVDGHQHQGHERHANR